MDMSSVGADLRGSAGWVGNSRRAMDQNNQAQAINMLIHAVGQTNLALADFANSFSHSQGEGPVVDTVDLQRLKFPSN